MSPLQGEDREFDDLREIVDRCCDACSKGDNPESIAAYLWSNIAPRLAEHGCSGEKPVESEKK